MQWSIRKKLILFLFLVTVIPGSVSIGITYYYTTESVKDRFINNNYHIIEQGKKDITSYFQNISHMSLGLYANRPFMQILEHGADSIIDVNNEEMNRTLIYLFYARNEIEQLHLYIDKGKDSYTVYNSKLSSRGKYLNISSHPYYQQLLQIDDYTLIEATHPIYSYNQLSAIPRGAKEEVISFHNKIMDIPSGKLLGILSIDVNLNGVKSIVEHMYDQQNEDFYIVNQNGQLIYSSDDQETLESPTWIQEMSQRPSAHSMEWKDSTFSGVLVYDSFDGPLENWYIVKRIPYDVLYKGARDIAYINIFIGLFFIIIIFIAALFVSVKITAPIKVLIQNIKNIETGKLEVDFDTLGKDEFGVLGRHFKSMIHTINDLIVREYRLELENKTNQLRVLQSQVNPHFLYNALQSIGTLSLKHQVPSIYKLITSLSSIMRYSMNMKEDIVPLSKEIAHVKAYLILQKQRFGENFEYTIEVEEVIEESHMPKMILQPIVENFFKHGFPQKRAAQIGISVFQTSHEIKTLLIMDNGKGVSEEKLQSIRTIMAHGVRDKTKDENIGLHNIYERLRLYYGSKAEMEIHHNPLGGFLVKINIPISVEEEVSYSEGLNSR